MKIIDIIGQSAELLGLTDVKETLNSVTVENEGDCFANPYVGSLYNLIQFSIQELCTNYVPVTVSEKITTQDCKYQVNKLNNFIRIQNVLKQGEPVKFKIINRNIIFESDGDYEVEYLTYPQILSIFQDIDFLEKFNPDVIVFGLCAYFALSHGLFEEFKTYHAEYIDKAENLRELKTFTMPQRRWE